MYLQDFALEIRADLSGIHCVHVNDLTVLMPNLLFFSFTVPQPKDGSLPGKKKSWISAAVTILLNLVFFI